METVIKLIIALSCLLLILVVSLAIFFSKNQSRPRTRSPPVASVSAGSSSRSRMASRWAHMEQGSIGTRRKDYQDEPDLEVGATDAVKRSNDYTLPNEFGTVGGDGPKRLDKQASTNSFVGTGPNGTRTFLKGWFGLDEPSFSGIKVGGEEREKSVNGDVLAMSPPSDLVGANVASSCRVPHYRIPTTEEEEEDWETNSNHVPPP